MNWMQLCSSVSSSGSTPSTNRLTTSRQTTRWEHTTPNNVYQGVRLLKNQDDLLATPLIDPRPVCGPANVVNTLIYLVHVDVLLLGEPIDDNQEYTHDDNCATIFPFCRTHTYYTTIASSLSHTSHAPSSTRTKLLL